MVMGKEKKNNRPTSLKPLKLGSKTRQMRKKSIVARLWVMARTLFLTFQSSNSDSDSMPSLMAGCSPVSEKG